MEEVIPYHFDHPNYLCLIEVFQNYSNEKYNMAWKKASFIHSPGIIWDSVVKAVIFGQLGRKAEAGEYIEKLFTLMPNFNSIGLPRLHRILYSPENAGHVVAGLIKGKITSKAS